MLPPIQALPWEKDLVPPDFLDRKGQRNNVHDFVYLNEIERRIIDTPPFQRLRHIKQLGFAHLVYETAEHSRFVHSLGVCHCAKLLVDAINRNAAFRPTKPRICWGERVLIGLAALLHDITHVPFSHAIEQECRVVPKHDDIKRNPSLWTFIYESEITPILDEYSERVMELLRSTETIQKLQIEQYSMKDLVFQVLTFPDDSKLYSKTFEYVSSTGLLCKETYANIVQPYMAEVIGNTICADLIDYLLRDLLNTGITRTVDLKFLDRITLAKLTAGWDNWHVVFDLSDRNRLLRRDALAELLFLLETRYTMCERVYMHRTKLAASAMLANAYFRCKAASNIQDRDLYDPIKASSDDSLLRHLLRHKESTRLARALLNRTIYIPVFQIDEPSARAAGINMQIEKPKLVQDYYPSADQTSRWAAVLELQKRLDAEFGGDGDGVLVLCLPEQVAYKDPSVLVRIPSGSLGTNHNSATGTESHTIVNLRDVARIQDHVRAMAGDHNMLWRVYLLAHPDYKKHESFNSQLERVKRIWREHLKLQYPNALIEDAKARLAEKGAGKPAFTQDPRYVQIEEFLYGLEGSQLDRDRNDVESAFAAAIAMDMPIEFALQCCSALAIQPVEARPLKSTAELRDYLLGKFRATPILPFPTADDRKLGEEGA